MQGADEEFEEFGSIDEEDVEETIFSNPSYRQRVKAEEKITSQAADILPLEALASQCTQRPMRHVTETCHETNKPHQQSESRPHESNVSSSSTAIATLSPEVTTRPLACTGREQTSLRQDLPTTSKGGPERREEADPAHSSARCPFPQIRLSSGGNVQGSLLEFDRFVSDDFAYAKRNDGLSDEKLVGTIVDQMARTWADQLAQVDGLRALRNISYDENRRTLVGQSGGIRAALSAMNGFSICQEIQELGLSFLTDMCQLSISNKRRVGHSGGIDCIIASLRTALSRSSQWSERGCVALWTCCQDCELNQDLAARSGASQVVLTVMRKGDCSVSLQEKCLRATLAIVVNRPINVAIFQENGGVQDVLAALGQFPDSEIIKTAAMHVLCELLRQVESLRREIGKAGIIEDIEDTLPKYMTSKSYLLACCGCLRYLAFDIENRSAIAAGDVVSVLTKALEEWQEDEPAIISLLMALSNLTYDNTRNKDEAASRESLATLVKLLSLYKYRRLITEQTCRLLRNISDGIPSTKRACIRGGVVAAVATAMKGQPAAPGVQEHGAALMLNLSGEHGAALGTTELEEHIDQALALHAAAPDAVRQLSNLRDVLKENRPRSTSFAALVLGVVAFPVRAKSAAQRQRSHMIDAVSCPSTRGPVASKWLSSSPEDVLQDEAMASAVAALGDEGTSVEY